MEFILLTSDESPWLSVLFDLLWSSHGAWKVFSVSVGILSFFCTMKFSLQRCRWCSPSLQKWKSTCLWQERNPFGAGVQLQEKANSSRLEYSHWHVSAPLKSLVIYTPSCLETSRHSLMSVKLLESHYSVFADWSLVFFILQILYLRWSFCSFALWGQG